VQAFQYADAGILIVPQFDANYVNNGRGSNYPSGVDLDFSHGATITDVYSYLSLRPGLYFVKCRACGASALFVTRGNGTVKLACNIKLAPPAPASQ
jgi:hypothetical protein